MIEQLISSAAAEDEDAIDEPAAIADGEPLRLVPHNRPGSFAAVSCRQS